MKSKIEIILTGTGAAEPVYYIKGKQSWPRRHPGAVVFVQRGNKRFGIKIDYHTHSDIGMLEAKIPPSAIDILLISHAHEDHLSYRFFASKIGDCPLRADPLFNKKPVTVYGPRAVIDTIVEMLARKNIFPFEFRKRGVIGSYQFRSIVYPRKKILTLCETKGGTLINPFSKIEIKFVSARHFYQSAYASRGFGKKAFGFLIRDQEIKKTFLYLTDYADMIGSAREDFFEALRGYKIDLFILGSPIPLKEKRTGHMFLDQTLTAIRELRNNGETRKNPVVVFTHLSDRWLFPETIKQAKEIFKKYKFEIWLPPRDGVKIELSKKKIAKKAGWLI